MPEGPEVWILSKAINRFYDCEKTKAVGKHLFVFNNESDESYENWSFGLSGTVHITDTNELHKQKTGIVGENSICSEPFEEEIKKLGINWMTCSNEDLFKEIDKWVTSKKKLAGMLLDQTNISGIGVAWGSEILNRAELRPELRCCDQNLHNLAESMVEIRENLKPLYANLLDESNSKDFVKDFVNEWFANLYKTRAMNVYKKGSQLNVLGRNWWV